jgi:dynein intermediate chain 1
MAVYALRWNPFHPRVFLSCSADWTVRIWDSTFPKSIMMFDVGTSVGDATWAPYSSTVFAAVTDEGKVHVWDLYANKHDHLSQQKLVKKAKCTKVAFNERGPLILVGDSHGAVTSLKLSPNLRKVTPIPVPVLKKGEAPQPLPSRLEVEIRKFDKLLLASDAKISIVTPLPGPKKKAKAAAEGAEGEAAAE